MLRSADTSGPEGLALGLYTALFDGKGLNGILSEIAEALGAVSHAVHSMESVGGRVLGSVSAGGGGLAPGLMDAYGSYWVRKDPWAQATPRLADGVQNFARIVPAETMVRSEYWNEWSAPRNGAFHCISVLVSDGTERRRGLAFHRRHAQEPFAEREEALLATLFPHLRRALLADARLGAVLPQVEAVSAGLSALPYGIVLLDRSFRLVYANPAAEAMAAEGDGLSLSAENGITASDPVARQALLRATGAAVAALSGRVRMMPDAASLLIPRRSGRPPRMVQVLPVLRSQGREALDGFTGVMLIITERARNATPTPVVLRQAFGLTPAEASLAAALAAGKTLAEHAARRHISVETARGQLSAIRRKTGTRRQADLTALLARLAP